jgi:hypothetical protein
VILEEGDVLIGASYQIPDDLWNGIKMLLPPPKPKKKRGRPRMEDRLAMNAVFKGGCATISENILGKYVASEYTRMNPILLNDIFANAEGLALGARDIWQENQ